MPTCSESPDLQPFSPSFRHAIQANVVCSQTCRSNVGPLPPSHPTPSPSRTKTSCISCTQPDPRKHMDWGYMLPRPLRRIFWRRDHHSGQSGAMPHSDLHRSSLHQYLRCRCMIRRSTGTCRLCRISQLAQNECTHCVGRTVGDRYVSYSTTQQLRMKSRIHSTEAPVENRCQAYTAEVSADIALIHHTGLSFGKCLDNRWVHLQR